jgi:hypothetical protein
MQHAGRNPPVRKDAEVKTTKSGNEYTVLSLATQASWKDEYVNRTDPHRWLVAVDEVAQRAIIWLDNLAT